MRERSATLFGPWTTWKKILCALIFAIVAAWRLPSTIGVLRPPSTTPLDFFQEWASARNALSGYPVYTSQQESLARYLGSVRQDMYVQVNIHPPATTLVTLPLAHLDYPSAMLAFNVLSIGLLLLTLAIVFRALSIDVTRWDILVIVVLLLLSNPFRQQITQGQWNLLLLFLLTAGWAADRSGRAWTAGVLVGFAAAIKLFPAFLGLYFLGRRNVRALAGMAAGFLIVVAVSSAILGPTVWVTYVRDIVPQGERFRSAWVNASLPGLWSKLFNPVNADKDAVMLPLWVAPQLATVLGIMSIAMIGAVTLWISVRAKSVADRDFAFALATIGMLLAWPLTWSHAFLMLLLPVLLLWQNRSTLGLLRIPLVGLLAVLWIGEDWLWFAATGERVGHLAKPWHVLAVLSVHLYALLAMFGMECMLAFRSIRNQSR